MAAGKRKSRTSNVLPKEEVSPEAVPPLPLLAASTRALAVPEILTSVLGLSKKEDLACAALTCRKWSPVALDHLWKELDSIAPLLALVQPLRSSKAMLQMPIGFGFEDTPAEFGPSTIQTLAVVHPFGPSLLPNLDDLSWCCTTDDTILSILPFISSSLSTLKLDIEETVSEENFQRLFRSLAHRAPNLGHFKLSTPRPVTTINESLAQWFNSTPKLQTAILPQFFHTPEILASLGRLPQLHGLETDWSWEHTDYIQRGTSLLFPNGTYPSLRTLHFHSSLALATKLLKTPGPVSQLKEVCFSSRKCHPFKSLEVFLSALARGCPQLEVLFLNFATIIADHDAPDGPLTLDEFRPCLALTHLREFRVAYDYPFTLRDVDVWEMSRAWKNLRALRLCSDPDPDAENPSENAGTPINVLKTFSVAIPNLEYLSLYFLDKEVPQFEPDLALEGGFIGPFELDVGFSVVPGDDDHAIGYFLGSLCRQIPVISMTQTEWTQWGGIRNPLNAEEERKWVRVKELAGMICQAKMSFNTRIQTLLSEAKSPEGIVNPTQQIETRKRRSATTAG